MLLLLLLLQVGAAPAGGAKGARDVAHWLEEQVSVSSPLTLSLTLTHPNPTLTLNLSLILSAASEPAMCCNIKATICFSFTYN